MFDLTAFQRDTLFVVNSFDQPHGLAIQEELEEHYDQEIHHGRLYPNLDVLVEKGLVDKGMKDRRTNYYTVTEKGEEVIHQYLEWQQNHL